MIRFGLKLGIAAGATYYTVEQGVWKDSNTTEQIYNSIAEVVSPYITEISKQTPIKITDIPTPTVAIDQAPAYWNKAVNKSCIFLWHLPDTVYNQTVSLYNQVSTNPDITKLVSFSSTTDGGNKENHK